MYFPLQDTFFFAPTLQCLSIYSPPLHTKFYAPKSPVLCSLPVILSQLKDLH